MEQRQSNRGVMEAEATAAYFERHPNGRPGSRDYYGDSGEEEVDEGLVAELSQDFLASIRWPGPIRARD